LRIAALLLAGALVVTSARMVVARESSIPTSRCRRLPEGKRVVRLNLKPNTEVVDLVAWISSITCKQFVLPAGLGAGKTVTVYSPQLISAADAYQLFLDALDSVGLTVYASGPFLRIIEVGEARKSPIPVVVPPRDPG
jgi:type II secretory pathway component GspD/PulD (secretin)